MKLNKKLNLRGCLTALGNIHRGVSRRGNRRVTGGKMALSRARSANANSEAVTRVYFIRTQAKAILTH